ncbi:MAG: hypothetical protein KJO23_05640, partial [Bacteroidia bacterium]|nr:hypothetical protein [Bacteroidia bacterium]
MRVLQLTVSSQGGAGIAALRLHRALRAAGIDSAFLSKDLVLDYKGESMEDDFFYYKPEPYWKRIMLKLRHALWPITWVRIKRELG